MKRVLPIAAVATLAFALIVLHSAIKEFLWTHPWWHSFLVALPAIALPILAYFELRHSGEANRLRVEAIDLQRQVTILTGVLDAERNSHLQQIAKNTEKPITQAEKNADTLRRHLNATVTVSEDHGNWAGTPEIVKVSEDNVVTLFTPRGYSSSSAWCASVHCGDLEITDIPQGSCPLRLKVLKRYGPNVGLGEITRWEDRLQPAAEPAFAKAGGAAYHATYSKPGSSETRSLHIYASADGKNSFLLEASTGETVVGDNEEVSKRFMVLQIEYEAAGFGRSGSGTSASAYRLFIR